jgi:hypothetical protein
MLKKFLRKVCFYIFSDFIAERVRLLYAQASDTFELRRKKRNAEKTVSQSDFVEYFLKKLPFTGTNECEPYHCILLTITFASVGFYIFIMNSDPGGGWVIPDLRPSFCGALNILWLMVFTVIGIVNLFCKQYPKSLFSSYSVIAQTMTNGFLLGYVLYTERNHVEDLILALSVALFAFVFLLAVVKKSCSKSYGTTDADELRQKCINFNILLIVVLLQCGTGIFNTTPGYIVAAIASIFLIAKKQYIATVQILLATMYFTLIFFLPYRL